MSMKKTIKIFLVWVIHIASRLLVLVTHPVFRYLFEPDKNKFRVPPADNALLMKPASVLASMIRRKEVSSYDVVKLFVERAKALQPLNAIVTERYNEALDEARKVDEILLSSQIPEKYSEENAPFLGVPFTAKEAFAVTGLRNSSGLLRRQTVIAQKDADVVRLLRDAGAIPLGTTNCSELCMWYESSNLVYGRTVNAYHQGRIVGGSSGGEGCCVAAAGTAMGVGSDIGGSIRLPSFFNGVFGHKSSVGMVCNTGQYPDATGEAQTFLTTGPMVRYATDLMPMFKVMTKHNKHKLKLDQPVDVKKLKYFYMEDDGGSFITSPVDPQIKQAIRKAAEHAKNTLGAEVKRVNLRRMRYSFEMWITKMATSGDEDFNLLMGGEKPVNPFWEFLLWLLQRPRHTLPAIGLGIGEKIPMADGDVAKLKNMCEELKEEFRQLLGDDGVFLYPTYPVPAPYHNQPLTMIINFSYTGVFNILGLPSTSVPMGISKEGVPIGFQVVGNFFNDHHTIAVAEELERAFGGWVPPFSQSS